VTVASSSLLTAFLSTLYTPSAPSSVPALPTSNYSNLTLPPSSSSSAASLSAPLSALLTSLETHQQHLSTLSFQSRQLARDRARVEALPQVVRRRNENAQREKEGLPLLPLTAEELALKEPSRLETMCALGGIEGAAKTLSQATGVVLAKSYGAKAGQAVAA
jgi:translation initiation factor 3 subunit H